MEMEFWVQESLWLIELMTVIALSTILLLLLAFISRDLLAIRRVLEKPIYIQPDVLEFKIPEKKIAKTEAPQKAEAKPVPKKADEI
jgi:hypothetical protein